MKLSLVVLTPGKGEGKVIPIALSQFLIGRDPQCHLRPASPVISKRHCALITRGEQAFVRDFDSTNGTFLNDHPIKGEVELPHGDRLKCGPLAFAVQIETGTSVSQPTPPPPLKVMAKPGTEQPNVPAVTVTLGSSDDEAIAQMLLELGDEGTGTGEVPEGSTIMD